MTLYALLGSGIGSGQAIALAARLSAWHDAMVVHERRIRTGEVCDEDCPHAEAGNLWVEAVAAFGPRAQELTFLRSRAGVRRSAVAAPRAGTGPAAARAKRSARADETVAPA